MIENDHEHDLGALIKQGYSSPLPEEPFVESLGASLCRELPSLPGQSEQVARLPRRRPAAAMQTVVGTVARHRRLAMATVATVVATLLALPSVIPRTANEDSGISHSNAGDKAVARPNPLREAAHPPKGAAVGLPSLAESVPRASLIVRAKATEVTPTSVHYRVAKVIHGKLASDIITVAVSGRNPATNYPVGQDVIVFLRQPRETDEGVVWTAFRWVYDVPPNRRLDDQEKTILAAIAKAPPAAANGLAYRSKGATVGVPKGVSKRPETSNTMQGRLQFGKIIPVLLTAGTAKQAKVVEVVWIQFKKENDQIKAALRVLMRSGPKGKWRVTVRLLDKGGGEPKAATAVFENSGIIKGIAVVSEGDLYFTFGPAGELSGASHFLVKIEPVPEDAKTTAELIPLPRLPRPPKGNRSLEFSVVGPDGKPPKKVQCTIWRKLGSVPKPRPLSVWSDRPIYWQIEGETWTTWLHRGGSRYLGGPSTIRDLPEGLYRVTAISSMGPDVTPVGATNVLDLTGEHTSQKTTVHLKAGHPLTIKVVDAKTAKPKAGERVLLRGKDGMPIACGSRGFRMYTGDDGSVHFGVLQTGTYRVEVGQQGWWNGKIKAVAVEVKAGDENKVVVSYGGSKPARLD